MQKTKLNEKSVGASIARPHFEGMTKNNKGITLIALIITIIVMLILVGVTINVALNGGLFEKAETATKETEEKAILEEMLAMMEITDEGKIDYTKIKDKMIQKYNGATYNYPNITIPGKLGTYSYIVSETEIKIGSKEIKPFDWEDVGLIVDTDTDYKFYDTTDSTTYVINFTTDGKLIVKADGTTVETYDAKDDNNINDDGYLTVTFALNGTPFETTLTMNSDGINVDAELKGLTTITYEKIGPKEYPLVYGTDLSNCVVRVDDTRMIISMYGVQAGSSYQVVTGNVTDFYKGYTIEDASIYEINKFITGENGAATGLNDDETIIYVFATGTNLIIANRLQLNPDLDASSLINTITNQSE